MADTSVQSLLAEGLGLRIYAFGHAPQGVKSPYVVWKLVGGSPENYLGQPPDVDWQVTKVEVHSEDPAEVREVGNAIIAAVENDANVTGWVAESYNPTTKRYVFVFLVDWIVNR